MSSSESEQERTAHSRFFDLRRLQSPLSRALLVVGVAVVLLVVSRLAVAQVFAVPSDSMQPTLTSGQRLVVLRPWWSGPPQRGDIVVFDGRGSFQPGQPRTGVAAGQILPFGPGPGDVFYVKRIVGLPGDRVACCDSSARLTVNDAALDEPYLAPGVAASDVDFDIVVPAGRLWVLGDNRGDSADSRDHLGDPGGGMVPIAAVIGEVVAVAWPPGSAQLADFSGDGNAGGRGDANTSFDLQVASAVWFASRRVNSLPRDPSSD